ncbi:cardiolipin synthase [Clostridium sp. E02]|uniref:cardiolipin synthase n=1 Tax=Clostridium sp. E02 TaxID=2487134 RepID=UPI000F52AD28|nr:cardiolipin synthase [Clostridium sp. E02]
MKQIKRMLRIIFGRTMFVVISLMIQIAILLAIFGMLRVYTAYFYGAFTLLSAFLIIYILNKEQNPSFKMTWMIPIAAVPVFGSLFYLFVELQIIGRLMKNKHFANIEQSKVYLEQDPDVTQKLLKISKGNTNLAHYIKNYGHYPAYGNTNLQYFPLGELMFEEMKKELEGAKRFIFIEFFIIDQGEMWDSILEILERKAGQGVEVRVMYDGMGSLTYLPYHYCNHLREKGIKANVFSPVKPALTTYQNNRDHRKILVVDGHTAFTGGINLADEYINRRVRFGHWKDSGIMLKGDAVTSFTMMFLQMWNISEKKEEKFGAYLKDPEYYYPLELGMDGFVIPYGDSPLDQETVGKQVYLDIIHTARRYVYIMTPYLILDFEMINALTFAAKRGVETRIVMPRIPDKKFTFLLSRSHYKELIKAGVQILEYSPGFIHGKVFLSDDIKAAVGTINMDYRSLYLHFECGTYIYKNEVIQEIQKDFKDTFRQCHLVSLEDLKEDPCYEKFAGRVLRLFSPLM